MARRFTASTPQSVPPLRIRYHWVIVIFLLLWDGAVPNILHAQSDTSALPPLSLRATHCGWTLGAQNAIGFGTFRDMGTSPVRYKGVVLQPTFTTLLVTKKGRWCSDFTILGGVYEDAVRPRFNFSTFGINHSFNIGYLHRVTHWNNAALWVGGLVENRLSVKVNLNYENASAGVSDLIMVQLRGRYEYFFATRRGRCTPMLAAEVGWAPVGLALRPGYAFIDNYTQENDLYTTILSNYEWRTCLLPLLNSSMEAALQLRNGNRVGLNYQWSFATTWSSGHWRYDEALHLFNLFFLFKL